MRDVAGGDMQSQARTVDAYLAELPEDRRRAIEAVRQVILQNLDDAYEEGMQYGMIGYYVPHRVYPPGYHCDPRQPLPFAGLASQKNHMAVYMMAVYGDQEAWFRSAWAATGKRLDMGKCCVRFKKLEDLALDVIGKAVARVPVRKLISIYETNLRPTAKPAKAPVKRAKAAPKKVTRKAAKKPGRRRVAASSR
jgi:hypothetical protein